MSERFVDGAAFCDLSQPLLLRCVEISGDMDVAGDLLDKPSVRNVAFFAIVGMDAPKIIRCADGLLAGSTRQAFTGPACL